MMALLPVLLTNDSSRLTQISYLSAPITVVAGTIYQYGDRRWLCLTSGHVSMPPTLSDRLAAVAVTCDDSGPYPTLIAGGATFRDITGHPDFGWGHAVDQWQSLYIANNELQVSSTVSVVRPNLGANTVYIDHTCSIVINRPPEVTPYNIGIAMWGYYRVTNEIKHGAGGPHTGYTIGMPAPENHYTYVSVDASSPGTPATKGVRLIVEKVYTYECIFGGYGTLIGIIFDLRSWVVFSGAFNTICHLWFEDCELHVRDLLDSVITGGTDGSIGSDSLLIDLMFRRTPMVFYGEGSYTMSGRVTFEDTYISREIDTPPLRASSVYSSITFTVVDFRGLTGDSPLIGMVSTYCPMLEVLYDGCVGLRTTLLRPLEGFGRCTYRVEIRGGELDGVSDPHRYLLLTESYDVEAVGDTYALSSATNDSGGLASLRIRTQSHLIPGDIFYAVHSLVTWTAPGVYMVTLRMLLPDTLVVTSDDLWMDVSGTGTHRGHTHTTRGIAGVLVQDTEVPWVAPYGYSAYRITIALVQELEGSISATVYFSLPDTTLYISGSLHTVKVA